MRFFLPTICTMFAACTLSAQITLPYEVDFSTGVPSDWEQTPTDTLLWEPAQFGSAAPGSAVVDMSTGSYRGTSRIELPAIHLTWLADAVLQFNTAFVRNNFMAPAITLWYNKGEGWKLVDSWGEAGLADLSQPNHLLEGGTDYQPPLNEENIIWHSITVDLQPFAGEQNIRFAFQAEFPNGGWVLLDDVKFLQSISGVDERYAATELHLIPNPATSTLAIETDHPFARIELFDMLGRNVLNLQSEASRKQLDISELPAGSYWLQLIDRDGTICGRKSFIKQ